MNNNVTRQSERDILVVKVRITDHAYDRAKERLSWKPGVLDKMTEKAYLEGIKHKDTKGQLNKYITKIWFKHKNANNIRIYGENIYLFCDNILVTVYQLPGNLRQYIKHCRFNNAISYFK